MGPDVVGPELCLPLISEIIHFPRPRLFTIVAPSQFIIICIIKSASIAEKI